MKNKRGFTLIELLAVIVILAIIALIATPIILNMINEARKSSAKSAALGYIDAIEYNNGFAQIGKAGYTEVTGTDVDVTTIDVKVKGKKPDSGTITVGTSGKITEAKDLCFNGYKVDYDGKDVTLDGKCGSSNNNNNNNSEPSQPSVPEPVAFSTDSWETIATNTTSSVYEVGQTKTITMDVNGDNTPETYTIVIVNMTPCTTETSKTACGLVLQFDGGLNISNEDDKKMNISNTSVGGWEASAMRTYLNNEINGVYSKLPSDLKSVIMDTTVVSGRESGVTNNYITTDKLYLLSTKEVGYGTSSDSNYDSAKDETRKLDYYDEGFGTANNKRRKYIYGTTTRNLWWLRSVYSRYSGYFYAVKDDGIDTSNLATARYEVIPAFRVGK